jgi:hypothetical protein
MHLYNEWLPPPVAEETKKEKESFARVVRCVKELHRPDDPESVYATLKWISVIELFVRAKSELSVEDVSELVEIGLQIFHSSENKLYAQVRKIIPERTPATCSVSSYTLAFPFFMLTFWVIGWLWYHRLDGVMF